MRDMASLNDKELKAGQVVPELIGASEGMKAEMTADGCVLSICFDNLTEEEVKNYSRLRQVNLTVLGDNLLDFTLMFEGLGYWCDVPFNPHFSPDAASLLNSLETACSRLSVILADTATGEVKFAGSVPFDSKMSDALKMNTVRLLLKPCDEATFKADCEFYQSLYTPGNMVQDAVARCEVGEIS